MIPPPRRDTAGYAATVKKIAAGLLAVCTFLAGCTTSTGGTAVPDGGSTAPAAESPAPASPAPTGGRVVGTAVMRVTGSAAPVTIRYRINGGPEQVETVQALPWERSFEARDQVSSSVTADGGDEILTCTIMMGSMLVGFKVDPRPTCTFYYVE